MRESITYDFGQAHRHGVFHDLSRAELSDSSGFDRLYRVTKSPWSPTARPSAKTKKSTSGGTSTCTSVTPTAPSPARTYT